MSRTKAASGLKGILAVVGAMTFGALCCGGAPLAVGAIAGVGLGDLLGGPRGALVVAAAGAALLLMRRARRAGQDPAAGSGAACGTHRPSETPAPGRAGAP